MTKIYFDESGNTGPDLLNADQPTFALCSIYMPESDFAQIHSKISQITNVSELKFSLIKKNPRAVEKLFRVLKESCISNENTKVVGFHKRFSALVNIVDKIVEPYMHIMKFDAYERGFNICTSNMLYTCLPVFVGELKFTNWLTSFIKMTRDGCDESISRYLQDVSEIQRSVSDAELHGFMNLFKPEFATLKEILNSLNGVYLDPAIPAFVDLCTQWKCIETKFIAVHDTSKPLKKFEAPIKALMDKKQKPIELGYDYRKAWFPLSCKDLYFEESINCIPLQIADVIVGASTHYMNNMSKGVDDEISRMFVDYEFTSLITNAVWPSADVTPESLGIKESTKGVNMVNYLTNNFKLSMD